MMSATKPMTDRYPNPELADLPTDIRDKILGVQEKAGFVPNVFLTLARRPEEFRAFFAYHDAVMERAESRLTKGEREMIVTATSALNSCLYCVVAHGAVLRIREKSNSLVRPDRDQPSKGGHHPAPARHARFRRQGRGAGLVDRGRRRRCSCSMPTALMMKTSGTFPPSLPSLACPTGWPTPPACCPMLNFTPWVAGSSDASPDPPTLSPLRRSSPFLDCLGLGQFQPRLCHGV